MNYDLEFSCIILSLTRFFVSKISLSNEHTQSKWDIFIVLRKNNYTFTYYFRAGTTLVLNVHLSLLLLGNDKFHKRAIFCHSPETFTLDQLTLIIYFILIVHQEIKSG